MWGSTTSRCGSTRRAINSLAVTLGVTASLLLAGCQSAQDTQSPKSADKSAEDTQSQNQRAFLGTLFSGAEQFENFSRINELLPTSRMAPAPTPVDFPLGEPIELPSSFRYGGQAVNTADFLRETDTSALLVVQAGQVRFERYSLTGGRNVNWLSMSVAKSFVSALIGIAVAEGHIASIEEPVTDYVPGLAGSAYDGVAIKDILQMSSGARWNEDYSDPNSDVARLAGLLLEGASFTEFSKTLVRENAPGTVNLYNSTDTQVLGELLSAATGKSLTQYMHEKLWQPLGMESPGYWIVDNFGVEMAFGGLNATARDYAKLGELYRNDGRWQGEQVVPKNWVAASLTADAPHLLPSNNSLGMGYGYQWWLMDGEQGDYSAIGVYNQFIYVHPTAQLVIVKLSANSDYALTNEESSYRELESVEFFRAIAQRITTE